jgi:hypothetical protein
LFVCSNGCVRTRGLCSLISLLAAVTRPCFRIFRLRIIVSRVAALPFLEKTALTRDVSMCPDRGQHSNPPPHPPGAVYRLPHANYPPPSSPSTRAALRPVCHLPPINYSWLRRRPHRLAPSSPLAPPPCFAIVVASPTHDQGRAGRADASRIVRLMKT